MVPGVKPRPDRPAGVRDGPPGGGPSIRTGAGCLRRAADPRNPAYKSGTGMTSSTSIDPPATDSCGWPSSSVPTSSDEPASTME